MENISWNIVIESNNTNKREFDIECLIEVPFRFMIGDIIDKQTDKYDYLIVRNVIISEHEFILICEPQFNME